MIKIARKNNKKTVILLTIVIVVIGGLFLFSQQGKEEFSSGLVIDCYDREGKLITSISTESTRSRLFAAVSLGETIEVPSATASVVITLTTLNDEAELLDMLYGGMFRDSVEVDSSRQFELKASGIAGDEYTWQTVNIDLP